MPAKTFELLSEQLALADALLAGREKMIDPQDLPGRYGRVVAAIDRVLTATACEAAVGGGWAVWRHGYVNRVTQDIDIILPANRIAEFLRVASVSGFQVLATSAGRWPKIHHKDTNVQVDILPEGQHPGTPPDLAPTIIPSPATIGAVSGSLRYILLPTLIELKIAAGRMKDKADVVELIRANRESIDDIRQHLLSVHASYADEFDQLLNEVRKSDAAR